MALLQSERDGAPMTFGAIADAAFSAYGKRLPLYVALALAGFGLEFAVGIISPSRDSWHAFMLTGALLDAAIAGAVSYGVLADANGDHPTNRAVLNRMLARLGILFALELAGFEAGSVCTDLIFGPAAVTAYGLMTVPALLVLGFLPFPIVAAATNPDAPDLRLLGTSIADAAAATFRLAVFGRVVLIGILLLAQPLLGAVFEDLARAHHLHDPVFWAGTPLDAIIVGPLQAFLTIFYQDLRHRQSPQ